MLIDQNIDILIKNNKHWIGNKENITQPIHYLMTDIELNVEYFENNTGKIYEVKDVYDDNFQINKELRQIIFIIGMNSLKEIEELYRKKHEDTYIIVIEPSLSIFNYNLNFKDLSIFKDEKIFLFADDDITMINEFLRIIFSDFKMLCLLKNSEVYLTYFYRHFEIQKAKNCVKDIKEIIRSMVLSYGNDVKDSLIGLKQNLDNLKFIPNSRNPLGVKDKLKGYPAIVVAAGPSLNNNIQHLKSAQGKSVIIAVDTIISRLLSEGIIPDFVCSVERDHLTYEYFYKDKNFPKTVTLVGPLLLDTQVFETFKGEFLLPFRTEVKEYQWLQHKLEIDGDVGMLMGMSCAHVAFGVAHLLGCSPITLIGQDLAYGESVTHASGTLYDDVTKRVMNTKDDEIVEGYYGTPVRTTKIWTMFRNWYENKILMLNLDVINATEGGAKIKHTRQLSLKEMIDVYCKQEIPSVYDLVVASDKYKIDVENVKKSFEKEIEAFESFNLQCTQMIYLLRKLEINEDSIQTKKQQLLQSLSVTDALVERLMLHPLLTHNLQSVIIQYMWNKNSISDSFTVENLLLKRKYQLKVLEPIAGTISEVVDYLKESLEKSIVEG